MVLTVLLFDTVMVFRRLKRFLLTGGGGVHISRFSLNLKPAVFKGRFKRAGFDLGLLPFNKTYVVKRSSISSVSRKDFGDGSI